MKDWFIKAQFTPTFCATLHRPVYMTDDNYKLKREIKRALIEIREFYTGVIVIPYSGGFDSVFVALCFKECVEQGTLN